MQTARAGYVMLPRPSVGAWSAFFVELVLGRGSGRMVVEAITAYLVTELCELIRDFVESGISVVNDILAHVSAFAEEGYAHCVSTEKQFARP